MAGQLEGASAPGQLPKMSPLETAKVLATGDVSLENVERLSKISLLPVIVRLIHFGRVHVPSSLPLKARQRDGGDRRTRGQNGQQCDGRRERWVVPVPKPDLLARRGAPRTDRLAAEETSDLVRQFLSRRMAALGIFFQAFE